MGDDRASSSILLLGNGNGSGDDPSSSSSEMGSSSNSVNKDPRLIARPYQLELSRKALEENVIVVLETGCGKTLISILLMSHMAHLFKKNKPNNNNNNKNVCVFLAPTVVLVHQQAKVIGQFTDFKVGIFSGDAKHLKTHSAWEKEIEEYEVLVMTPQVLLRSLCHCFIRMELIALLIFDECHYAQCESSHPYAEIMKIFYDPKLAKLPRVFGMTASPICGKGASINSLEALLHAKVYTVNDKSELDTVIVTPIVQVYLYSSDRTSLSSSPEKCLDKLREIKRQVLWNAGDVTSKVQNKKLLQRLHNDVEFCLSSLGLWGGLQACRILLNGDGCDSNELVRVNGNSGDALPQNDYLTHTASLLDNECGRDVMDGITSDISCTAVVKEPFFSQKVARLVGILSNFRSRPDMKCIIFVNRIIVARCLSYILGQIKILSAWRCDYLVGVHSGLKRMSRKTMNHILEKFRSGKLNLLVATKVGEEGLDIQTCCLVIRFDLPDTLASFIQSRGRARMPQSEYAFLVDRENEREMSLMESFKKSEELMNIDIITRKSDETVIDLKEEVYTVGSTGATISTQTSVSLLYHYCSKLPRDEYFNPKPELYYVNDPEGTVCHIILPCNAPIHHILSTPQSSMDTAKRDACLKACKELHGIGALTDYLLPEEDVNEESNFEQHGSDGEDEDSPFELQEMLVPAALKEPWFCVDNLVCLNCYVIRFIPEPHDRHYKEFALFVKAPLPHEAEGMKIELHLALRRSVFTDLVPCGVTRFNEKEMQMGQKFQEMFLKVILDRTEFTKNHVLLKDYVDTVSNSSTFYLLLPVKEQENVNTVSVDWMVIRRCLSSPIFRPPNFVVESQIPLGDHFQLADGPMSLEVILNSLVYVPHKKSFFFVSQVLPDKNGYSLLNSTSSHVDHMSEKFGIHLLHPEQRLLQAKQLFCLRNLLHDRKIGNSESRELEEHFFELPPELCQLKIIGFSKDIGSSLSLIPSIMHRLENLLVAVELKDMLSKSFAEGADITAERVLEALTTEKCLERFSLERLEVLGDAFLKFAVGRHVFLKHEASDEGQLTRKRSNVVNNSNLCRLVMRKNLQVYIRDEEFYPNQYYTIGRPCPTICTKETEKSIHSECEANLKSGTDNRQRRCSMNHHWLSKKTIADMLEALVGAYIVDSGFKAATAFLRWIGIYVDFEVSQVCRSWITSSSYTSLSDAIDITAIEGFLGHQFVNRGLLTLAFIHPSYNRHGGGCYQRLEFLGDAVLDYLITSYLYSSYPELKPGQLTDLRSSLVNNRAFAIVAASRLLHKYIICDSVNLQDAISKYVSFLGKAPSERILLEEPPCPKALGDLVESCIGAALLDKGFDLNSVWEIMLSFLEPIMSFSSLQLSPIRELHELCQCHGWNVNFVASKVSRSFKVEASVSRDFFHLAASATNRNSKVAKRMAAQQLVGRLKAQGYQLKRKTLEELLKTFRKREATLVGYDELPLSPVTPSPLNGVCNSSSLEESVELTLGNLSLRDIPDNSVESSPNKNQKSTKICRLPEKSTPNTAASLSKIRQLNEATENANTSSDTKGDASNASAKSRLHELCVANYWRRPCYECCKEEGPSHLKLFTYKVEIVMEEAEDVVVECIGQPHAKKKEAAEDAAQGALWFLNKAGYIKDVLE